MSSLIPDPLPQYAYKIVDEAPTDPFPETFPPSELDHKDGFIHLSASWQIPITADLFFKDVSRLWVVKIRSGNLHDSMKWEGPEGCVHLYGEFGRADVESVKGFERGEGQGWKDALKGETWLE